MDLIQIEWADAEDFKASPWANQEEADAFTKQDCLVVSIGWVVKRTRYYIAIASDFDTASKNYGTLRKIPRKMIKTFTPVPAPAAVMTVVAQKRTRRQSEASGSVHHPSPTPVAQT